MCGRYVIRQSLGEICAAFAASTALPGLEPCYNAAPETQRTIIIRDRAGSGNWGWRVASGMSPIINIRSETAGEKPLFAASWRAGRRCIVPASGFYEWDGAGQPFYVESQDTPLLGLCGLWVRDPDHSVRFAILTRGAEADLAPIHPRMPLVATPDAGRAWLMDGVFTPAPGLAARTVGRGVNDVSNNSPSLLDPAPPAPQGNLFAAGQA